LKTARSRGKKERTAKNFSECSEGKDGEKAEQELQYQYRGNLQYPEYFKGDVLLAYGNHVIIFYYVFIRKKLQGMFLWIKTSRSEAETTRSTPKSNAKTSTTRLSIGGLAEKSYRS